MKIRNKMAIALRMARKKLLVSVILFWIGLICLDGIQKQWAMDSGISKNTKF